MKIFVIGKAASITHWLEDCVAALRGDGHEVAVGIVRDPAVQIAIERLFHPAMARILARRIHRFSPDLILAIGAYHAPSAILEQIAALPSRAPLVGWVGDLFSPDARRAASLLDRVAYTDSGLEALHRDMAFPSHAFYLPHAVNPHGAILMARKREPSMVFVGNPTVHRRAVIEAVRAPLSIHGPGWSRRGGGVHDIHAGRVKAAALGGLYAGHLAALNIRNERNVLIGLNQRNFQPYLTGTVVVTDAQPDLTRCFEPGKEVFAYRDTEHLNAVYERLRRTPEEAAAVGEKGRRRVLADHTYGQRLKTLMRHVS